MTNNKQTTKDNTFYLVDLTDWVYGTIEKVEKDGKKWNDAWWDTYKTDLEGTSEDSGKKGCPKNGTKTLYKLGRIQGAKMSYDTTSSLRDVLKNHSKNGVYSLLAIDILSKQTKRISLTGLWDEVKKCFEDEFNMDGDPKPAKTNQGATTVAYKLWHLG